MRAVSVGDVVTALRDAGLVLLSDPGSAPLAVRQTVLLDPRAPLPTTSGGILLVAGIAPDSAGAEAVVREAAVREYSAIVVRPGGDDTSRLARLCDDCGLALLGVHDDVEWLHLASLLETLIGARRQLGDRDPAVGDLFGLANAIAQAVGGATAIEDVARRVLAYSTVADQAIDPDRREGILGRQVPELPENDAQYRELYRTSGPVRFDGIPPALGRLAVAIRAGTETLGSIWVVEQAGSLTPEAERTLASAAPIAALHLLRARHADDLARQQRTELAGGILAGDLPTLPTLRRLGMDASGPFAVLAFTPREVPEQDAHRLPGLLALQLDPRLGRTATCVLGGIAYVIAAGSRVGNSQRLTTLARDVVTTARTSLRIDLLAAVGRVVDRADALPASQSDTRRVLTLLLDEPDREPVASAEGLATTLILDRVAEWLDTDLLTSMAPGADLVVESSSASSGHALLLRTWLARGRDVSATARELGVHPNTVRYRLRRAAATLGVDYEDSDQVLLLWLMLRNASRRQASNG